MKEGIHPKYEKSVIACACGNVVETRSTVPKIHVEICSACHPFFTGKQKLMDTQGRVERALREALGAEFGLGMTSSAEDAVESPRAE